MESQKRNCHRDKTLWSDCQQQMENAASFNASLSRLVRVGRDYLIGCVLLAGAISFLPFSGRAASGNSPWFTRAWQTEDGLPLGNLNGLAQSHDGYFWLAAESLTRFDGVRFEQFDSSRILPGSELRVEALLVGHDDSLWLAMNHGTIIHLKSGKTQVYESNQTESIAQTMLEDAEGAVWIASRAGPLVRIKDGQLRDFSASDGWPTYYGFPSLIQDKSGLIWFAKKNTVGIFRNGRFENLRNFGNTGRIQLASCRDHGVWICAGSRLLKFDRGGTPEESGTIQTEHAWTVPTAMLEDRSGAVWIGTSDSGLFHYDASGIQSVQTSHRQILCLAEDREGNIWAGTGGGLNQMQPRVINSQTAEDGLPFETVQSLCEDNDGTTWATTQNGLLAKRTGDTWSVIADAPPGLAGTATCLAADRTGSVWIGTRTNALHSWDKKRWTTWGSGDGIPRIIHNLLVDSQGDLWISGDFPVSLQRLHAGRLEALELPASSRYIHAMTEDSAGNIWAGTVNGMLFRIASNSVTDMTAQTFASRRSIRCLCATPDGSLWIATGRAGLGRLKNGRFARINTEQGLPDDSISQIASDGLGRFWLGCEQGIYTVRQCDLDEVAEGRAAHIYSVHYGRNFGLPSMQANFGFSTGPLRTHDGHLWMPMRTALIEANPGNVRRDPEPTPALLKRLAVDEQTVAFYGGTLPVQPPAVPLPTPTAVTIPPTHHRLEFEFTALSFSAPGDVDFRYRLEGIDEKWIEAGAQRSAIYSRLPAGDYSFRIAARNSEGIWNEQSAALLLTVTPFFWQTVWLRIAALAVFTSLVVAIARYVSVRRLRQKLRVVEQQAALDRERTRIARDLHDDLGAGMTGIVLLSGLALREYNDQPEKAQGRVEEILDKSRHVIKSLDEIVWAVNPANDTAADLISYISQFAIEFLQMSDIQCQVDLPDELPERPVSSEVRHSLFLVVKEALNNAIRHARASEIRLHFTVTEDTLLVSIEDNGRGFKTDHSTGDGLGNMGRRMTDMGGEIQIKSEPGSGTQILLTFPWPSDKKKTTI